MIKKLLSAIILKDILDALWIGLRCCFKKPVTKKIADIKRSENFRETVSIDESKCIRCGICEGICPNKSIKLDKNNKPSCDHFRCCYCGLCKNACPKNAISLKKHK